MIETSTDSPRLKAQSPPEIHYLTRRLQRTHVLFFTAFAGFCAFGLYTCVYALRKTFAAATFDDLAFFGVDFKVWLVTFQVCGYAISKFIGIRIISELQTTSRHKGILVTVLVALISWLLFACTPAPYNVVFLFFNGLSLGLVWGMVFGYLEGRKVTESLGAAMSVSFIFSSGLCRSAGGYLLQWGIPDEWMPFVAACIFFMPLLAFLYLLNKVPPPSHEDEMLRTKRHPMGGPQRRQFIKDFLPGIVLFVLAYMMLTSYRDFRDNFSAEIWRSMGDEYSPAIYTATEIPVSATVLVMMVGVMFIKNNRVALMINHIIIILGMILIGIATLMFSERMIGPTWWMMTVGLGLYMAYVPFNSIFFDRLLASFRYTGTVGFIMYVADAFGYLGSVGVLFIREFGQMELSWLEFFVNAGYILSISGALLITASMLYFNFRRQPQSIRSVVGSIPDASQ